MRLITHPSLVVKFRIPFKDASGQKIMDYMQCNTSLVFAEVLECIHSKMGCADVKQKPTLSYHFSYEPQKFKYPFTSSVQWVQVKFGLGNAENHKKGPPFVDILVSDKVSQVDHLALCCSNYQ
jgi:hypothetical protein